MALWILLLIAIIIAFVLVHAVLLPKIFLKVNYEYDTLPDRGVKVVGEINGKSIIYEPDVRIRKFVKQYIVSERNGKKIFVCKIDENIRYIEYDIVQFDAKGNSFKVLSVSELIKDKGYTRICELSDKTAYVTVVLNCVNNTEFNYRASKKVVMRGVALFLVFATLAEVACILGIKACIAKISGGIFYESFVLSASSWIFTAVVCAAVIIINVICTFTIVFSGRRRKKRKGEDLNVWL